MYSRFEEAGGASGILTSVTSFYGDRLDKTHLWQLIRSDIVKDFGSKMTDCLGQKKDDGTTLSGHTFRLIQGKWFA